MNGEQKRAWFALGLVGLMCIGFVVLGLIFGIRVAWAGFSIMALGAFSPLIGRGEKLDERDRSISRHATVAGGMASYGAFVLACMGVWFVVYAWNREAQVSVHLLPVITMLGGTVFFAARSVAVLILYGRHMEAGDA
jgi:hypothetical protein